MAPDIHPNTEINSDLTVKELESDLENKILSPDLNETDDHYICDFCSKGVPKSKNPRIGQYLADNVLNNTHPKLNYIESNRPLIQLATYCEECSVPILFFPCIGFSEVRIMTTITEDWKMKNIEVTDVSDRDDGIDWDPKIVSEKISTVSFEENTLLLGNELWGPENIFTVYDSAFESIDMGSLINYDGTIDPKKLGRARKEYRNFRNKMKKSGYNRRKFSKHVRDKG